MVSNRRSSWKHSERGEAKGMPEVTKPDPAILSRILLLQSALHVAPDLTRMGDMYCSSLPIIPGVTGVVFFSEEKIVAISSSLGEGKEGRNLFSENHWVESFPNNSFERIHLATSTSEYGFMKIIISDEPGFAVYRPYIQNTANLMALIIENRERTAELSESNDLLVTKNEELEAFASAVSHDLRSPLRGISGFSRMIREDFGTKLNDKGNHYIEVIQSECIRMSQIIEDLLGLAKLSGGKLTYQKVNLSELVTSIADKLQKRDRARQVEFAVTPGLTAQGDSRLLKIALENLVGNAWKFTSRRRMARIELGKLDSADTPTFYVRDDGVGFPSDCAADLFRPFQRLHSGDEFEGTGVGLATVQRIIHRHGGEVWADGAFEKGATFYFTLHG